MPTREVNPELVERWRQGLARSAPHRWWVAESVGTVVGFAGISPSRDPVDPMIGELDTIAVDPDHWRVGIGRSLMEVAIKHLESDGYQDAIVWTLESYPQGQRFYESTGWARDGGVRDEGRQVCYRRSFI
jgi:GNAT superfamily N-acetyltransferase